MVVSSTANDEPIPPVVTLESSVVFLPPFRGNGRCRRPPQQGRSKQLTQSTVSTVREGTSCVLSGDRIESLTHGLH